MDKPSDFRVIDNGTYYTIENIKANDFNNYHTHLNKKRKSKNRRGKYKNTCELLISLVCNETVPDSPYLRTSAKRISRNKKYIRNIEIKEEKDRQRQYYFNPQKGVRR